MLLPPDTLAVLALALAIDAIIGDPRRIWRILPHPVVLIGRAIAFMEARANRIEYGERTRSVSGALCILALLLVCIGTGFALEWGLARLSAGPVVLAVLASILLAQNSLVSHVAAVARGLGESLASGRAAVSMIVGRDPSVLDEAAVARAAIESDAENFSDGLVAPAFWFAVAGLPGILAYKALNTADSMIGHKSERYRAFGQAAARLDDLANYVPARIAGLLIVIAASAGGGSPGRALRVMIRDARRLASPNAGFPEAAMAGALNRALAGPRHYADGIVEGEWLNEGAPADAKATDIHRAVKITWGAWTVLFAMTATAAAIITF
ncbi:adenosylcobinamide-phosphate synthase [Breoghania corrubedonensis]|uniref:Cobalamin biosynthesis protein CobD n=1 Tax=Breoghania corrubedonensis TaxID=665038 RepID=A0A2T5V9E9_9HYPH|nr:adenosylcobinamide-phosphate synthase CbiB [Breoghania corrubedonensis]PTW60385.1 adenosylcobinamide-phosphate synthase [Breoghania corrubedonensis]